MLARHIYNVCTLTQAQASWALALRPVSGQWQKTCTTTYCQPEERRSSQYQSPADRRRQHNALHVEPPVAQRHPAGKHLPDSQHHRTGQMHVSAAGSGRGRRGGSWGRRASCTAWADPVSFRHTRQSRHQAQHVVGAPGCNHCTAAQSPHCCAPPGTPHRPNNKPQPLIQLLHLLCQAPLVGAFRSLRTFTPEGITLQGRKLPVRGAAATGQGTDCR
jgi:hypothetical protein